MFDDLTTPPACDDRSVVRYAPGTGAVTAATPARLVAEITSPSFLDYELISDFFLTYRAFLDPEDLLRMLIARLRWAITRDDEVGMIVHVRGFVAMRHWVLNYFIDDFLIDYGLRLEFCKLLNGLVEDLNHESRPHKIQLKALNEMKKCWRRVCSQYWDGDEFDENIRPEEPITPGGAAGDRNSKSIPAFWEDAAPTRVGNLVSVPESTAANFASSQPLQGRTSEAARGQRPSTPDDAEAAEMEREFGPFSPASQASLDVISCSFPLKQLRSLQAHSGRAVGAHPVSTSPVSRAGPVATTPRALMGKRVRPTHPRERSSSLPENVIEEPAEEAAGEDADKYVLVLPPGASLVRGDVLPPGHAYVQMAPGAGKRQTTVFYPNGVGRRRQNLYPDGMAGLGVKKFIGSVRRVLSTRGQNGPEDFPDQYMGGVVPGRYGNPVARLPGTAVVPLDRTGLGGAPPRLRIDVLAAKVSEEFKAAVREDAREEAGSQASSSNETELPENQRDTVNTRAASQDFHSLLNVPKARPTSDGALTGRSKSIIIVDDTYPSDSPLAHGGFMTCNPSVEAFADALMRSGAEITPPMTPPANERVAAARRSSYLLNEHLTSDPSVESLPRQLTADPSMESLPPFVPDWDTMGRHSGVPSTVDGQRMSHATFATHHSSPQRARRPPPVSGALHKMHQRNKSSRTRHSFSSAVSRPANASFSTGIVPPSNTQSIAGTSYTRYSAAESDAHASMPKPLRMLRRRPGGDLRAATNVDDLDQRGLRRSRSLGSLATFSDSMLSSQMYSMRRASTENFGSVLSGELPRGSDFFSVGQLAGNNDTTTHRLSVHGTFSSRPAMRPSFEADAERLAQIPDDGDDGGVESALLKLEGKYEGPSPKPASTFEEKATPPMSPPNEDIDRDDSYESSEMTSVDSNELLPPRVFEDESLDHADTPGGSAMRGLSFLTTDSYDDEEYYEESYKSTPLLDGGNTEDGESKHEEQEQEQEQEQEHQEAEEEETADWNHRSILTDGVDTPPNVEEAPAAESQRTSFEFVHTTEALGITQPGQTTPPPPDTDLEATPRPAKKERPESHKVEEAPATEGEHNAEAESFFDSDLSSELSEEDAEPDMPIRSPLQGGLPVQTMPTLGLPSPPNSHSRKLGQDTTQAPAGSPGYAAMTDIYQKPLPLTPDETPAEATPRPSAAGSMAEVTPYSIHLPFVLAFDSETLAQQFTLIEKDALNEIDWKELVDMDWRKAGANQHSRSWVDFLRNTDAQGVEVVIARFNLVVKWAVSQVVLTRSLEERARCVVKLIHVAACCRRYRNFATLAQLAIALSSPEVSRLERTWALVPAVDTAAFRDLEALVSPTRNFFNIRVEMESGPPDLPCIPFVGIYTHDLLYNAQRPSEVASSPTTAPLVNFERCRIAAGVIKTLLRLLEASSRFSFQPLEGVTERCLWIGALADDEIRRYSAALV